MHFVISLLDVCGATRGNLMTMEDLSFYSELTPGSSLFLDEYFPNYQATDLDEVPDSKSEESSTFGDVTDADHGILRDFITFTDVEETASTSSLDPESPCSLISLQDYNDLKDNDLRDLPVRELNKRLRNLPVCEIQKIRKRRRSLKNRGYALNCRLKRQKQKTSLEEQNTEISEELGHVKGELEKVRKERNIYKAKYEELQKIWDTYCNAALFSGRESSITRNDKRSHKM